MTETERQRTGARICALSLALALLPGLNALGEDLSDEEGALLNWLRKGAGTRVIACPRIQKHKHQAKCVLCRDTGQVRVGNGHLKDLVFELVDMIDEDYGKRAFRGAPFRELQGLGSPAVPVLLRIWSGTWPGKWACRRWTTPQEVRLNGCPMDFVADAVVRCGDSAVGWVIEFVEEGRSPPEVRFAIDVLGRLGNPDALPLLKALKGRLGGGELGGVLAASMYRCGDAASIVTFFEWCRTRNNFGALRQVLLMYSPVRSSPSWRSLLVELERASLEPDHVESSKLWARLVPWVSALGKAEAGSRQSVK